MNSLLLAVRRMLGAGLLALAALAALIGAALSLDLASRYTDSVVLVSLVALAVSLLFGTGFGALAFRAGAARTPLAYGHRFGLALTALLAVFGTTQLFKPLGVPDAALAARHDTQYWQLATGSRLAYSHFPASGQRHPEPIVYLHGGPGAPLRDSEYRFFEDFAREGYDVYLYEQVGTGRSDMPGDLGGYTVGRGLADLEAIRAVIGAERMVLVGQSWGAALAAHYTAANPQRVAKLILPSPGPIRHTWSVPINTSRTAGAHHAPMQPPLRVMAATYLTELNPRLAVNFAPAAEMNGYMGSVSPQLMDHSYCAGQAGSVPQVDMGGFNFYANLITQNDLDHQRDLRPALWQSAVPTLVMKGECDYVPWAVALDYRRSFSNSRLVYLERTGHLLWGGQPELSFEVMRAFLADAPLPLPDVPL